MKKSVLLVGALLLSGCVGDRVSVGTGEVGKVVDSRGIQGEIYRTSSFRLAYCGFYDACPYLVKLDVTKQTHKLKIDQVFITKSKVDLENVEVAIQFHVRPDEKSINQIFKEIKPESGLIPAAKLWQTYLQRKVPNAVVDALRDHSVDEILGEIPRITEECKRTIAAETKDLPVQVTEVSFPNGIGDIPKQVMDSYRKLYAVEADKQRQIKSLAAELEIEKQRLTVQRVRAKNDAQIAKDLGLSVDKYMELKITERYADAVADAADNNQPFALGSFPMSGKQGK